MFYREAGQFKTSYAADRRCFRSGRTRSASSLILFVRRSIVLVPLSASDFVIQSVMIPFLIFSLAAIGLNLLTGYTGLLSLGTGAFMGVGAFACYKLTTYFPGVNIIVLDRCAPAFSRRRSASCSACRRLRIKGFYLAVATLAAQFFLSWCFIRIPWLYNYNISASIEVPTRTLFGIPVTGPTATPVRRAISSCSRSSSVMTWLASNLVHGRIGRTWMAVRDMDIAAELIGIQLLPDQAARLRRLVVLLRRRRRAAGVPVARQCRVGRASTSTQSFLILFMVIIGGLGSLLGSFFGAALIFGLPIVLRMSRRMLRAFRSRPRPSNTSLHKVIGALIIFFLIAEPNGLARLWQIGKQKLRVWPFPY